MFVLGFVTGIVLVGFIYLLRKSQQKSAAQAKVKMYRREGQPAAAYDMVRSTMPGIPLNAENLVVTTTTIKEVESVDTTPNYEGVVTYLEDEISPVTDEQEDLSEITALLNGMVTPKGADSSQEEVKEAKNIEETPKDAFKEAAIEDVASITFMDELKEVAKDVTVLPTTDDGECSTVSSSK